MLFVENRAEYYIKEKKQRYRIIFSKDPSKGKIYIVPINFKAIMFYHNLIKNATK